MADAEDVVRIWGPFLDYLKKMEVALKCSMCSNMLEKPTSLPCNHMFCSGCIDRATRKDSVCPSCKLHFLSQDKRAAVHIEKIVSIFNEMDGAIGDIIQQSLTCAPDKQVETNPSLSSRENQDSNFCTNDQGAEHVSKNKDQNNLSSIKAFACGACGQLGHIRTNKSCPNYREDLENQDLDCISERSNFSDASQLELKSTLKNIKYSPMRFECDSGDNPPKRRLIRNQSSDKYTACDGAKVKASKKINRVKVLDNMQFDNLQPERYQSSMVPDEPQKNIIAKKRKLSTILESERQILATEVNGWSSKEKDIDILLSLKKPRCQERALTEGKTKGNQAWSLFKEEKKYRGKKRISEEKSKTMLGDEHNLNDWRKRSSESRKYEEPTSEGECKMANRRKDGKKKANFKDAYLLPLSNYQEVPKVGWDSKLQKVVGSRQSKQEPIAKYSKAGKVELSYVLRRILKILRNSEVSNPFLKLFAEREAPNYFKIIKCPMDLSTISQKIRNMEYQCREDFRHDVFQITYNAHIYYDREKPQIAALADGLLELCDHYLEKRHEELNHAEDATKLKDV